MKMSVLKKKNNNRGAELCTIGGGGSENLGSGCYNQCLKPGCGAAFRPRVQKSVYSCLRCRNGSGGRSKID